MDLLTIISQHQAYAYRASSKAVNDALGIFNKLSSSAISSLRDQLEDMSKAELTALAGGKYTTPRLKRFNETLTEWIRAIESDTKESTTNGLTQMAEYESAYMSRVYGAAEVAAGATTVAAAKKTPLAGGLLFDEVFKALSEGTKKKALHTIRQGISNGWTTQEITRQLKGKVLDDARYAIERDVRTIRAHVANTAYQSTFEALGYKYVKFLSVLDGRTSKVCAHYSNNVYKTTDNYPTPPLHPNCRSVLVGVDKDGKIDGDRPFVMDDRPVSKIPKDQRDGKIGQVDANMGFKEFFEQKATEEFKKEWLGATRYKLYKDGKLSLDKFTDPTGREYTLAELRQKDEEIFKKLGL